MDVYELCYINPQYIYFKIKYLFVVESIFRADYDSIISLPCVIYTGVLLYLRRSKLVVIPLMLISSLTVITKDMTYYKHNS